MKVNIQEVSGKSMLKKFIDFPHDLYKDDPNYVPELYIAQKELHSPKKNHFFDHAEVKYFLAFADGKIVGRITGHVDHNYNSYHKTNIGWFGFFDCIDDQEVANALLDNASQFVKSHKVDRILGPANFSLTTDVGGMLIDGHESPPQVMMSYNANYYPALVESYGFGKEMDMYAFYIKSKEASDRTLRVSDMLTERLKKAGITVRNIDLKNMQNEIKIIKECYDQAWQDNWGFVPATEEEFQHMAEGLKLIIDPDFTYIAEHEGKAVGYSVSLPNINEITKGFKKGRLLPFNFIKLLLNKKKVNSVRIVLLGVIEEFRGRGIEAIFYANNIKTARRKNMDGGEASWILENNIEMINGAKKLNGKLTKTYRIYSKNLKAIS